MSKVAEFVCKHKKLILIITLLLLIPSIIGMKATRINYDILVYLPEDIETIQGEDILSDEFNMGGFSIIVLDDMKSKDIEKLAKEIKKLDNVGNVISTTDLVGTNIPIEMFPDEIKDKVYKDGSTIMLVTFKDAISSDSTMDTVQKLRDITDERCKISGMTATLIDTRDLSNSEIAIYVIIAVALCLLVLEIALDSYVTPVLLLANIGIAILFNMGTNIFLGEISYITKAISAVLQLGVTMDFAIFLYHSYKAELKNTSDINKAMETAIQKTFTAVLGSSLTTIAGFLALCSMSLTLGKDIGIVMAKGVLFGVISVVTILPAMILQFNKAIEKTSHKEILPKFTGVKNFVMKHYKLITLLFIIILPIAIYTNNNTQVYYKLDDSLPDSLPSITANNELKDKFGLTSEAMILVDKDLDDYKVNEMLDKIEQVEGVDFAVSYSKIDTALPKEVLSDDIKSIFTSDNYQMIIVSSKYEIASNELNNQINEINKIIKEYDEDALNKYDLKKNNYYFSMCSLEPNKNFRWIAEEAKRNPNCVFAVAGSINKKVFADGMGFECPDNMKLLGYVSDEEAKTLMRDCKAFLFPTFYEGFGIPPLEAMSAGAKNVYVSDAAVMHEVFEDSVHYINPYKYNDVFDDNVVDTEECIRKVLSKYSWKKSAEILSAVISTMRGGQ